MVVVDDVDENDDIRLLSHQPSSSSLTTTIPLPTTATTITKTTTDQQHHSTIIPNTISTENVHPNHHHHHHHDFSRRSIRSNITESRHPMTTKTTTTAGTTNTTTTTTKKKKKIPQFQSQRTSTMAMTNNTTTTLNLLRLLQQPPSQQHPMKNNKTKQKKPIPTITTTMIPNVSSSTPTTVTRCNFTTTKTKTTNDRTSSGKHNITNNSGNRICGGSSTSSNKTTTRMKPLVDIFGSFCTTTTTGSTTTTTTALLPLQHHYHQQQQQRPVVQQPSTNEYNNPTTNKRKRKLLLRNENNNDDSSMPHRKQQQKSTLFVEQIDTNDIQSKVVVPPSSSSLRLSSNVVTAAMVESSSSSSSCPPNHHHLPILPLNHQQNKPQQQSLSSVTTPLPRFLQQQQQPQHSTFRFNNHHTKSNYNTTKLRIVQRQQSTTTVTATRSNTTDTSTTTAQITSPPIKANDRNTTTTTSSSSSSSSNSETVHHNNNNKDTTNAQQQQPSTLLDIINSNNNDNTKKNPYHSNPAAQFIPRPIATTDIDTTGMGKSTKNKANNGNNSSRHGNFIRLNLRNKGGSCHPTTQTKHGSKGGKYSNKSQQWEQRKKDRIDHYHAMILQDIDDTKERNRPTIRTGATSTTTTTTTMSAWSQSESILLPLLANRNSNSNTTAAFTNATNGTDIIDDYMDGIYKDNDDDDDDDNNQQTMTNMDEQSTSNGIGTIPKKKKKIKSSTLSTIPFCAGHHQPCKLCTVKKSGPNQGRKFYVCATSRMDHCTTFIWVDDTVQATKDALYKNRSVSGFIARRVAAYMEQINHYTVPELKLSAIRYHLNPSGTKSQLRMRLSVWVRDEIANGCTEMGVVDDQPISEQNSKAVTAGEVHDGDSDDDDSLPKSTDVDSIIGKKIDDKSDHDSDDDDDSSTSSSDDELEFIGDQSSTKISLRCSNLATNSSAAATAFCPTQEEVENDDNIEVREKPRSASVYQTLQKLFGYTKLRDGQEWAINRCLNQQRSLLVAPTGFGKSLCYTLPAAMLDGICIVVSPLLSLIQDQIRMLPARLAAATLSGPMSTASVAATLDDIVRGRIKLLFLSPERLTSNSFRRLFRPTWNPVTSKYERYFPEVSLFCVDEAHCMSQWAHNFRPSYLRLQSIIDLIDPKSILAMTATAGPKVVDDICRTLKVFNTTNTDESGVRVSKTNRDNIDVKSLFLNTQEERITKLLQILNVPDKHSTKQATPSTDVLVDGCLSTGNVIVYTWRQHDAEVVAENIQASNVKGGVVVYHGGMDAVSRAKAQSKFMRGKARICVATIAFGLGINKADVAGIIHLYLSSSPEHYIQEIGRAGRDGRPAQAISLILNDEVLIRHSLAYSDLISASQVQALISAVRQQVAESLLPLAKERADYVPVNIAFHLAMSVISCDCKMETAETILSLLEQRNGEQPLLVIQGISYDRATIAPKRCLLQEITENEPVLQAILNCADHVEPPAGQSTNAEETDGYFPVRRHAPSNNAYGSYTFSVAKCSNSLGDTAEPRHVFAALRRLESKNEIDFTLAASPKDRVLSLRLTNEGMKYFKPGNDEEIEKLVRETTERFVSSITSCSNKVIEIHHIMQKVNEAGSKNSDGVKSASLTQFQHLIERYFEAEGNGNVLATEPSDLPNYNNDICGRELATDIEVVLSHLHNIQAGLPPVENRLQLSDDSTSDYTILTVTKFLHGLAPACIPMNMIRQHHLFGKMQGVQFDKLRDAVGRLFLYAR